MAGGLATLDCMRDERDTEGEGSSIFDKQRSGFCEGDGELVVSRAC
jgi:3-oxoacyl-(acyl-carrier-protein) synthase